MEIAELIQKQGENFDAFKKANDERLARIVCFQEGKRRAAGAH